MKIFFKTFLISISASAVFLSGCHAGMSGRYEDTQHYYVDFQRDGGAFTNIDAGGGEAKIAYDVDGNRVTLHVLDGNPTLRLREDNTLCCGPGGVMKKQ